MFVFFKILTKIKKYMLVLGPQSKDRKSIRDKANMGDPKVNRDWHPHNRTLPQQHYECNKKINIWMWEHSEGI